MAFRQKPTQVYPLPQLAQHWRHGLRMWIPFIQPHGKDFARDYAWDLYPGDPTDGGLQVDHAYDDEVGWYVRADDLDEEVLCPLPKMSLDSFTICAVIRGDSSPASKTARVVFRWATGTDVIGFQWDHSNSLFTGHAWVVDTDNDYHPIELGGGDAVTAFAANTWYHTMLTWNDNSKAWRCFKDGVLTDNDTLSLSLRTPTGSLRLIENTGFDVDQIDMADFIVWDRCFSDFQVAEFYRDYQMHRMFGRPDLDVIEAAAAAGGDPTQPKIRRHAGVPHVFSGTGRNSW